MLQPHRMPDFPKHIHRFINFDLLQDFPVCFSILMKMHDYTPGKMYLCNAYRIEIDTKNIFYDLFAYIIKIINVDESHKSEVLNLLYRIIQYINYFLPKITSSVSTT